MCVCRDALKSSHAVDSYYDRDRYVLDGRQDRKGWGHNINWSRLLKVWPWMGPCNSCGRFGSVLSSVHMSSVHMSSVHMSSVHMSSVHMSSVHMSSVHMSSVHMSSVHMSSVHMSSVHMSSVHMSSVQVINFV